MTHPFDAYRAKHRHQLTLRVDSGVQKLTVEFHRGYVHIRTSAPYAGEVFITRSAFLALIRRSIPIARVWMKHPAQDWDVPKAVHAAFLDEMALNSERREQKKQVRTLNDQRAAERKHRRWLAAKKRSQRS